MVSGTITNANGSTNHYESLGSNVYYQYLEFQAGGTLIKTTLPDGSVKYGTYTYNDANHSLSYKYDGDMYYYSAIVSIISNKEMNISTDYGAQGRITQYFVKL